MEVRYCGGFCGGLEFGRLFRYLACPVIPSALSMCPGTHDSSMLSPLFPSRNCLAVSNDICWLDPGCSFVIEATEDVLMVWFLTVFCSLPAQLAGTPLLFSVLSVAPAFRHCVIRHVFPFLRSYSSFPFLSNIVPIPLLFGSPDPSPSLIRRFI